MVCMVGCWEGASLQLPPLSLWVGRDAPQQHSTHHTFACRHCCGPCHIPRPTPASPPQWFPDERLPASACYHCVSVRHCITAAAPVLPPPPSASREQGVVSWVVELVCYPPHPYSVWCRRLTDPFNTQHTTLQAQQLPPTCLPYPLCQAS
jgi:hypothetical protein